MPRDQGNVGQKAGSNSAVNGSENHYRQPIAGKDAKPCYQAPEKKWQCSYIYRRLAVAQYYSCGIAPAARQKIAHIRLLQQILDPERALPTHRTDYAVSTRSKAQQRGGAEFTTDKTGGLQQNQPCRQQAWGANAPPHRRLYHRIKLAKELLLELGRDGFQWIQTPWLLQHYTRKRLARTRSLTRRLVIALKTGPLPETAAIK